MPDIMQQTCEEERPFRLGPPFIKARRFLVPTPHRLVEGLCRKLPKMINPQRVNKPIM